MPHPNLTLDSGLFDHMVLQRSDAKGAAFVFSGNSPFPGTLTVTARKGKKSPQKLFSGKVKAGRFQATAGKLPIGGPYQISLQVTARDGEVAAVRIADVLVGDVWLLGGQSNMQGCGRLRDALPAHSQVRGFFMDDRWAPARDPLHNLDAAVDAVHLDLNGGFPHEPNIYGGAGPGVAFGLELFRRTGVPQGLIACAHGGTSMAQWSPTLQTPNGSTLFRALVRRLEKNGGRVAGLIWYQGESDANSESAPGYPANLRRLIAAIRRAAGDRLLPVVMVQIGRVTNWGDSATLIHWNAVQEAQRRLPETVSHLAVVPSVDLTLDDCIHISGSDQNRLGVRLAAAMSGLREKPSAPAPGIQLSHWLVEKENDRIGATLHLIFSGVRGAWRNQNRVTGFSLLDPDGNELSFEAEPVSGGIRLHTSVPATYLEFATLQYGRGANPASLLVDAADQPVPVFGPVLLGTKPVLSPFSRTWKVAYSERSLSGLSRVPGKLLWEDFVSTTDFANQRERLAKLSAGSLIYRTAFINTEGVRLQLFLGYDGPLAAWVDGRKIFQDLKGTNPALRDESFSRVFAAEPGHHEIVLALDANQGRAWGVFLRLRLIGRGASESALPEWVGPSSRFLA